MNRKIRVDIVNIIIIVCILILSILEIFSNTLLKQKYTTKMLKKNNYYEKTYYDIKENFKNHIMQSGLDETILDNLYDMNKIENDVNMVINSIYENKDINIDTSQIRDILNTRINEILTQNNRKPDNKEKEAINLFEKTIEEEYKDGIIFSEKYVKKIGNAYEKIQHMIKTAKILLIVIIILLLAIILKIYNNLQEKIKTIGIILFTTGSLQMIIKLLIGKKIAYILILNLTFSSLIITIANSIINTVFITGIITTIIGLIMIIAGNISTQKNIITINTTNCDKKM